ncbi:MAG TPA: hypothetical protein VGE15_11410 [Sphingobacteriaceae bacterium]
MNQPTTYEQLIAQKLQELAVPDQANAIWATIEHQLNIEMPGNDPGSGGGGHGNWWMGGGSLLTLFVAVVTYISVSNQNFENRRPLNERPAVQHPRPVKKSQPDAPKDDRSKTVRPRPDINEKPAKQAGKPIVRDSLVNTNPPVAAPDPLQVPAAADTVPPTKKSRGVRGISDADYRLIPARKDTLRRKD